MVHIIMTAFLRPCSEDWSASAVTAAPVVARNTRLDMIFMGVTCLGLEGKEQVETDELVALAANYGGRTSEPSTNLLLR